MNILTESNELPPQDKKLDVLIVSPGGNGCGFLKQKLTTAGLLVGLTHKVVPDIDRIANSIIYLHNDPLLSLVCKMKRKLAFKTTLMRQSKKMFPQNISNVIYHVIKKHEEHVRVYITPQGEIQLKNFNQDQENKFVRDLLYATLAYQVDYCNMSQLFDDLYKMRDDLNVLFLDFRDPKLNDKIFEFLKVNLHIKFRQRKSKKQMMGTVMNGRVTGLFDFYEDLDKSIIDKINGAQLTSGITMVNPFNKPNVFEEK
jgi:hypothetical protein